MMKVPLPRTIWLTASMVKTKELSLDLRKRIVAQRDLGKGYKAISKSLQVPVGTVRNVLKKFKEHHTVANRKGRGRKPKISPKLEHKLLRDVQQNLRVTMKDILGNLKEAGSVVSWSTVQRCLHRNNLRGHSPRKIPAQSLRAICTLGWAPWGIFFSKCTLISSCDWCKIPPNQTDFGPHKRCSKADKVLEQGTFQKDMG